MISIPSRCFNGWSLPTGCFVLMSIAFTNLSPMSVWRWYAKSSAVDSLGSRKQSGRMLPLLSASFEPAGKIAMYCRRSKTDLFRTSWIPVEPYSSRVFFWIDCRACFCFSFILSSFILNVDSPWVYSISPFSVACLRESSASAEHGIIWMFGNFSCSFFRFSFALGLSILFAAISIGFVKCRSVSVKFSKSFFVHEVGLFGSSFSFVNTLLTSSSLTLSPENCFAISFAKFCFVVWIVRDNLSQTFSKMVLYHLFSSFSSILTSSTGLPEPSLPSASVVPDASTIWMNMSACLRLSKNLFPKPFPSDAPSTNPATSISLTGTNRFSPVQNPVRGLHFVLSSLHRAFTSTYPIPWFGLIVAKG